MFRSDNINNAIRLFQYVTTNLQTDEFKTLKSPSEVMATKSGSSFDVSIFIAKMLARIGLKVGICYVSEINDETVDNPLRFATVYFAFHKGDNVGKVYWFEPCWKQFAGIREFKTLNELVICIKNVCQIAKGKSVECYNFSGKHFWGESFDEMISTLTKSRTKLIDKNAISS